ncbi:hypothetical protein SS50377_23763 [Spironucleus salmonicida]|uniref:Uncharacterized protein n=1 Tax=Spironucleus salmonicida TaxID=348837 RepID=V6LP36_9EUKA|nr:hypothetical protein SS50377_23763 [Spironucleus salmonicida]|eukprot:EST46442.1 Hypothetical protein SS50377_fx077 [Spironucleus salmonicida]
MHMKSEVIVQLPSQLFLHQSAKPQSQILYDYLQYEKIFEVESNIYNKNQSITGTLLQHFSENILIQSMIKRPYQKTQLLIASIGSLFQFKLK